MTATAEYVAHEVRAWAKREGLEVGARGRLSEDLKAKFEKAPKRSKKAPKA